MATIRGFVSSLGPVAAVGAVGGNRRLPAELPRIVATHALLHAAERDLYEQAIIEGATRAGLPVMTITATGTLFDHASEVLGVALEPSLAGLGKSIGPPWQKDQGGDGGRARRAPRACVIQFGDPTSAGAVNEPFTDTLRYARSRTRPPTLGKVRAIRRFLSISKPAVAALPAPQRLELGSRCRREHWRRRSAGHGVARWGSRRSGRIAEA